MHHLLRRALLCAIVAFGIAAAAPVVAQNRPTVCNTGAFVSDIYNLSQPNRSFDADIWFWSNCSTSDREPLRQMEYMNANRLVIGLDDVLRRGNSWWSTRKVTGTWRVDWNVASYPFDRQTLRMVVEEGIDDLRQFSYEADTARSNVNPDIAIPGWQVTGFHIADDVRQYMTTFGDPNLAPSAGSEFSRLTIEVNIARDGMLSFFKLTAVVYISAILAMLSFRLDTETNFGDRFGLLVGTLFSTVVSMSVVNNTLGSDDQLTLIDLIHISCLLVILGGVILTLIANYRAKRGADPASLRKVDFYSQFAVAGTFVLVNASMIGLALYSS